MPEEGQVPRRTPSKLLIDVLEFFGESEPVEAIVVWIDEAGFLNSSATTALYSVKIGMLEMAKHMMLEKSRGLDDALDKNKGNE